MTRVVRTLSVVIGLVVLGPWWAPHAAPDGGVAAPEDDDKDDDDKDDDDKDDDDKDDDDKERPPPKVGNAGDWDEQAFPVPPPPFSTAEIYPCSECHEPDDINYERREFTDEHKDIKLVHGDRERWCFDCHNPEDRDRLRLAGGTLVPFERSYQLCGQCHGPTLRDWRAGVHGKRTGSWSGQKQYRLCVNCHNPHAPHFAPLEPKPRPMRPSEIQAPPAFEATR